MCQIIEELDRDLMPMPRQDMAAGKSLTGMQKVAEATYGVVAPANGVTIAGLGLAIAGCHLFDSGKRKTGVAVAIAGLLCDLADGAVARKTRTGNYLAGRHLDAVTDGVKAGFAVRSLYKAGIYTIPEIATNYAPKALGWLTNFTSRFVLDNDPKTSGDGKLTEFVRWLSPGLAVGSHLLRQANKPKEARIIRGLGFVMTGISFVLGMRSAVGYIKSAIEDTRTAKMRRHDKITSASNGYDS